MSTCNNCGGEHHRPVFAFKGYQLVSCSNCGLVYVANPPSQEALAKLYSADEGAYHLDLHNPDSAASRRMAQVAQNHLRFLSRVAKEGRLVDVGCSTGLFLQRAADAGFEPTGIEYSRESADVAYALTGIAVEHGSIHNTMLDPESADVVTMFDVIEHVPDPASDLAAAWRMLKPGGWLVLSTPNIDGLFPRASYPLANRLGYWAHPEPPYHLYQFSVRTLGAMLASAGFEVGTVEHHAIDLAYTFGTLKTLRHMPKRALYALLFSPLAKLGPLINMGDWFYIAARKPQDAEPISIAPLELPRAA